ncbi:C4-type zinc ribbon domain-containing protein [Campylobacter hyointestinalis]
MKINDKTYANVIKSEDIVTCPHCGRILYKDSE